MWLHYVFSQWSLGLLRRALSSIFRGFRSLKFLAAIVLPVVPQFLTLQHMLDGFCELLAFGRSLLDKFINFRLCFFDVLSLRRREVEGFAGNWVGIYWTVFGGNLQMLTLWILQSKINIGTGWEIVRARNVENSNLITAEPGVWDLWGILRRNAVALRSVRPPPLPPMLFVCVDWS